MSYVQDNLMPNEQIQYQAKGVKLLRASNMNFKIAAATTAMVLGMLGSGSASAGMINLNVSGILTSASGPFSVGDPFTATISYDTSAQPKFAPSSDFSSWFASGPFELEIGGQLFNYTIDRYYYSKIGTSTALQIFANDNNTNLTILGLPFNSALSLPPESSLSEGNAYLYFLAPDQSGNGGGNVNVSISAVPEPDSWALMLIGLFGLGAALRSSRRKQFGAIFES